MGEVADHLLHSAFHWEEFELPPKVVHGGLNAEQRAVLHAIGTCDDIWIAEQVPPNQEAWSGIRQDLLFLGLPTTQHDLQAFLDLDVQQEGVDPSEG